MRDWSIGGMVTGGEQRMYWEGNLPQNQIFYSRSYIDYHGMNTGPEVRIGEI
jgi:hypothetical protein